MFTGKQNKGRIQDILRSDKSDMKKNGCPVPSDSPWKILLEIRRNFYSPLIRFVFVWNGVRWGKNWRVFGRPIIQRHRKSRITIGDGLTLRSWPSSNPLSPTHPVVLSTRKQGAVICIGANVGITGGTICANERIDIGDRVYVGANCTIVDTDFHPINPQLRQQNPQQGESAAVSIGDDVFIGMSCMILKGVEIGSGSVIGAGSIVTRSVPRGVVVAGNPATVIREL